MTAEPQAARRPEWTDQFHPAPLRRVAWGVALAALAGLVLASREISDWAFELPLWLGPVRDVVLAAADGWHAAMQALGADRLHQAIADAFEAFRHLGWSSDA